MKKLTFVAAAFAFIGFASVDASAQTTTQQTTQTTQTAQTDSTAAAPAKETITKEQLPEPVKAALAHEAYKDWTVSEIYKVAPAAGAADSKVVYEFIMTNKEGKKGRVRLDETGKDAPAK